MYFLVSMISGLLSMFVHCSEIKLIQITTPKPASYTFRNCENWNDIVIIKKNANNLFTLH